MNNTLGVARVLLAIAFVISVGTALARHLTDPQVKALEATCEKARESKIAPLREQSIKDCIALPRSNPDYCRDYFKDFGEPRRLESGRVNPRMFHNIPECAAAEEARRHFEFYPP